MAKKKRRNTEVTNVSTQDRPKGWTILNRAYWAVFIWSPFGALVGMYILRHGIGAVAFAFAPVVILPTIAAIKRKFYPNLYQQDTWRSKKR